MSVASAALLLALLFPVACRAQEDREARGEGDIVRLRPSAFPSLPTAVAQYLKENGYSVPQCPSEGRPHNVIQGSFQQEGRADWAALVSKGGRSAILVFWDGTRNVARLADSPDANGLQRGPKGMEYSRRLSAELE